MSTLSNHHHIHRYTSAPGRYRPRGHVVGHTLSDPAPASLDGHPRGHVTGHSESDPAPKPFDDRPRGHVIGRASDN
jgi:hypothetical protein